MTAPAELVHVVRNGLVESVHTGDVAVCDADGRVLASAGDPERILFGRSCEKPVQGAVSFHAMDEPGDLPDDLAAVMCASHNGEPRHVAAVRRLLRRGSVPVSALQNPRDRMRRGAGRGSATTAPGSTRGMLVASAHRGWDLATYRSRSHPLQRRVTQGRGRRDGRRAPRVRRGRVRDPRSTASRSGRWRRCTRGFGARADGAARDGGRPRRAGHGRVPVPGGRHAGAWTPT